MKYAVVTGGTSGMGLGVAKMLLSKGYYVFATYVGSDLQRKLKTLKLLKSTRQIEQRCISLLIM